MLASGPQTGWIRDLPLCFPGRDCYDVPPGGAQAMYLIADLTPASPVLAALLWVGLGAALVMIVIGLRDQWSEGRSLSRPVLLAIGLILVGAVISWSITAWLGEAAVVYGGADGRPAELTPPSVVAAWPQVQAAAQITIGLGAVALLVVLNTAVVQRRRALREQPAAVD